MRIHGLKVVFGGSGRMPRSRTLRGPRVLASSGLVPLGLAILASMPAAALEPDWRGGHLKLAETLYRLPSDSLWREPAGAHPQSHAADLRLRGGLSHGAWELQVDYQLLWRDSDLVVGPATLNEAIGRDSPGAPAGLPDDDRRAWTLGDTLQERSRGGSVHRLDRLTLGWRSERLVLRLGRQALSWGNGLIFNPADVFNPFDPTAVDTQYKPGDDMVYAQYLQADGSDWQAVHVIRRDAAGRRSAEVRSSALKWHYFGTRSELDLLLARHFDETLLVAGGSRSLGGTVLRGDLVLADTAAEGWVPSLVLNFSGSWQWGDHNTLGTLEYFYNGHGLDAADYDCLLGGAVPAVDQADAACRASADPLRERLARGELFSLGRHYLAGSLGVDLTPLLQFTPLLLANLEDPSALLQLGLRWSLAQDWELLAALSLPLGPAGTEYGGPRLPGGPRAAQGEQLFLQLARYF